jgi:CubicO group peptidase (beta-lactamase class C family)
MERGSPTSTDHIRVRLARYIDRAIDTALSTERLVGVAVLIALDGEIVYERAAGFADREARITSRPDTIFRLASVSKVIASVAALAMMERQMLSLDDPVSRWLTKFRPRLKDGSQPAITIRQLMTHTAGLDYGFTSSGGPYRQAGVSSGLDMPGLSMHEAMDRLASLPLLGEPGKAWNYSLATDVLGAALESAGRAPLSELIRLLVIEPLGMTDTAFHVPPNKVERLAVPYADGMPRPVRMSDPHEMLCQSGLLRFSPSRILDPRSYPSAGAGMAGTARDLLSLLEAIRSGGAPVLRSDSAAALTHDALPPNLTTSFPGWTYGLGVGVLRDRQVAGVPHENGTWRWGGAYGNEWFVNPDRRLTVVSLSNTALEGTEGAYPRNLRDAIYYALTSVAGA